MHSLFSNWGLNILCGDHNIKKCPPAEYSRCHLNSNLIEESMVMKVSLKVNAKVEFLYRQNK